jgi:hypothetical protein
MQLRSTSLAGLICGLTLAVGVNAVASDEAATKASWQEHNATFAYSGFTTYYTCDGLEAKVRSILLYLGARKDLKVTSNGCANGPNRPSPTAWVTAHFHTLAASSGAMTAGAASGPTTGTDAVQAQWSSFELAPHRPQDMGDGECELVERMKPVITANFTLRDIDYRTSCIPHQVTIADYGVRGKILRLAQATK